MEFKVYYDIYNDTVYLGSYKTKEIALKEVMDASKRLKNEVGLKKTTFYVYLGDNLNMKIEI